jgi:hypothetical protein
MRSHLLRTIAAVVAGILCAFIAWNVVAALTLWKPTGYADHPQLGRIDRPGLYVYGLEGFGWSWLNDLGMRGPDVGPKRPGEKRLLLLGDSFTEALEVFGKDTYPRIVESALASEGVPVTVINTARNGASPASYLHLAEYYKRTFEPDQIVIQLSAQDFASDLLNPNRNFYLEKTPTGYRTVFNESFRSADPIVQRHPWIGNVLEVPVLRLAGDTVSKYAARRAAGPQPSAELGTPDEPEFDQAALDWTVDALAREYPNAIITFVPEPDYFGDPLRKTKLERAVEVAVRRNGLTFVDPRDSFVQAYTRDHVVATGFANTIPGRGHLNRAGHRMLAAELIPIIRERFAR